MGSPSGSAVKDPPALQVPQELQVWSPGQEVPLEEGMATHSSIFAWRIHRQRSLVGYIHRAKNLSLRFLYLWLKINENTFMEILSTSYQKYVIKH